MDAPLFTIFNLLIALHSADALRDFAQKGECETMMMT